MPRPQPKKPSGRKVGICVEWSKRKSPRLVNYDYSIQNYYFITICCDNHRCIFGDPYNLNFFGQIAQRCLANIPQVYPTAKVDKYVVMPNHVHAVIALEKENTVRITQIVGQYKMAVTKEIRKIKPGFVVWQRSFHDHIIRTDAGYQKIWMYIDNNPKKWEEDCFYNADGL